MDNAPCGNRERPSIVRDWGVGVKKLFNENTDRENAKKTIRRTRSRAKPDRMESENSAIYERREKRLKSRKKNILIRIY